MPSRGTRPDATTPDSQQPVTTPNFETVGQHSFLLQTMLELQRSFGRVEHAVEALEKKVGDQAKSISVIERTLWIAAGVVMVASVLIGVLVQHNYDRLVRLLQTPPAATAPAATPTKGSPPVAP